MGRRRSKGDAGGILALAVIALVFAAVKWAIDNWYIVAPPIVGFIAFKLYQYIQNSRRTDAQIKYYQELESDTNRQLEDSSSELTTLLRTIDSTCSTLTKPKEILAHFPIEEILFDANNLVSKSNDSSESVEPKKVSSKKMLIRHGSDNVTVEDFTRAHFKKKDYDSVHSEVTVWNMIWYSLYYDIFWSDVTGADFHSRSDMPRDFYQQDEFFIHRQKQIYCRTNELLKMPSDQIIAEIANGFSKFGNRKERILNADPKAQHISLETLQAVVKCLGIKTTLPVLLQLMKNQSEFRRGMPDLLIWDTKTGEFFCAEVKSTKDRLSAEQCYWFEKFEKLGIKMKVCLVKPNGLDQADAA